MSRLIRRVQASDLWAKLASSSIDAAIANPPLWAVRDFIPSERDGDGLSVFEVADDDDKQVEIIAAAWRMSFEEKLESKNVLFASVRIDIILEQGLTINKTMGNLKHKVADDLHRELVIPTVEAAKLVASLFLSGDPISVEGKDIRASAIKGARNDYFDFAALVKGRGLSIPPVKHLVSFVSDRVVSVRGNAV